MGNTKTQDQNLTIKKVRFRLLTNHEKKPFLISISNMNTDTSCVYSAEKDE